MTKKVQIIRRIFEAWILPQQFDFPHKSQDKIFLQPLLLCQPQTNYNYSM